MTPITPDLLRQALAYIPANVPRDEWAKVAMAIKSEYPDETGWELFEQWSASDADGYDPHATKATWRSVKSAGGVKVGTLLHLAKGHGFKPPQDATQPARAPSAAELAQRDRERTEQRRAQEAARAAEQEGAAAEAQNLWDIDARLVEDPAQAPYLVRKGVGAHGVKWVVPGTLLVPLRDATGKLWNVQKIAPQPTGNGSGKLFLPRARKSGLWHMLGTPGHATTTQAADTDPQATEAPPLVLLIAEGYATAATLHQATGHPVAVAFDAGNLVKVARALRHLYPAALLVLCGDDDLATQAKHGHNPGRDKAKAAAQEVGGLAVFPQALPPGGSDFNDLAQHIRAQSEDPGAGLAAVRGIVADAIASHLATVQAVAPKGPPAPAKRRGHGNATTQANGTANAATNGLPGSAREGDRFTVADDGVWHIGLDRDGEPTKPQWLCSRLDVPARIRDQDGQGWGLLLAFEDHEGKAKRWVLPSRLLATDGVEYRAALYSMGLSLSPSPATRNLLAQYLLSRNPSELAISTERIGWHHIGEGVAFVLPHETIGESAGRILFQSDGATANTYRCQGTPEQWRDRVGRLCIGNSRVAFVVAVAFAGPLLRWAGLESGGFHLRGIGGEASSGGKTTASKVAASVYGGPNYLQSWRTTDNAIEYLAAQHCDGVLIFDEIAMIDPKVIGAAIYTLANEQGKARATRTGAIRPRLTWKVTFLSSGEISLADHMAEGGQRTRAGQEVRLAEIPADAGQGMGVIEQLHHLDNSKVFVEHIEALAARFYGATGRAWLQWLVDHADGLRTRIKDAADALALAMVPEGAAKQVHRVGARFALVGAAGELATDAGLTGWPAGESERAARVCFNAWLAARGGIGNGEVMAMLRQVRRFLEMHGEGRFTAWRRADDDHNPKTLSRAGFRKPVNDRGDPLTSDADPVEFFVLPEVFKSEVCQGFDVNAVARVLKDHDCLVTEGDRLQCKVRLPGMGLTRCYRITPAIFALDL